MEVYKRVGPIRKTSDLGDSDGLVAVRLRLDLPMPSYDAFCARPGVTMAALNHDEQTGDLQ